MNTTDFLLEKPRPMQVAGRKVMRREVYCKLACGPFEEKRNYMVLINQRTDFGFHIHPVSWIGNLPKVNSKEFARFRHASEIRQHFDFHPEDPFLKL
jgi:hypothetical protein